MSSGASAGEAGARSPAGQSVRGEQTRRAIVEAAMEVFAVRGYRASALAEIAARVGVTPGGILYHFGSKEALLMAVIAERDHRAAELVVNLPLTGVESLRELIAVARLGEREPGLAALHTVLQIESIAPDAPAHTYFLDRSRFVREWAEQLLLRGRATGEVRADVDCGAKAAELVAYLDGAAVVWLLDPKLSLVGLYETFLETFIASVQGPRREGTEPTTEGTDA
jgi:AcrR family transcriptional regulator